MDTSYGTITGHLSYLRIITFESSFQKKRTSRLE